MASDHNVQPWDLLGQLHVPLVPAGKLHRHLDQDLWQVSPVSKSDDDVDPLGFEPCHLFGHRLQLVVDDEGARVGHLDGDGHAGDDVDRDDDEDWRMMNVDGRILTPPRSLG